MKATVSEDCIGCGLCESTAPEVFAKAPARRSLLSVMTAWHTLSRKKFLKLQRTLHRRLATAALLPPLSSTSPSRIHVQLQCNAYRTAIRLIISYHVRVASAALIYYVYAQNIKGTP